MKLLPLATRTARVLTALGVSSLAAFAQTNQPSPTTIHASARLVVVDVVVTDGHGEAVQGLKQTDFHLTEGKAPQAIRNFEEHAKPGAGTAAAPSLLKLEPGVFTNAVATPTDSTVNILLMDMLNTPMQDQAFVRAQLLKFLDAAKPGTRMAIFGLTTRLVMLQGFTTDLTLLRRVMTVNHPVASPTVVEKVGGKEDIVAAAASAAEAQLQIDEVGPRIGEALSEFNSTQKNLDIAVNAQSTLGAFNQLARYLAGIPGRKNLMWFSEAFPLQILPDTQLDNGQSAVNTFAGEPAMEAEYRETINLLARSRVAVYPIDARGLLPSPALQASYAGRQQGFSSTLFEDQSTMFDLAEATGGKAIVNTNGLAQAVEQIVDSGSNYYTLAYTPTDSKPDGKYRAIRVQLDGGGYKLAYQRGYYADTNANAPGAPDPTRPAESFIAPPSTQIPFYARVLPLPADAPPVIAPGDKPRPRLDLDKDRFARYRVDFSADPRNLSIATTEDGLRHGHLEFIVLAYDSNGKKINSNVKSVQTTWNSAQFTQVQQQGVRYQEEISVPATGAYSLRVMIHDLLNGQIGAIDVPLAKLPQVPAKGN